MDAETRAALDRLTQAVEGLTAKIEANAPLWRALAADQMLQARQQQTEARRRENSARHGAGQWGRKRRAG